SSQIQIPVIKYQLKNGMTVLLNPDPQTTLASYYLGVRTGSRHEREGITGISHMFEHLMFKGTKKFPDIEGIYRENGVSGLNAETRLDFTAYYASFPEDKLDLVLNVESDRMVNLQLTQEELDKERQVVQEERRMRIDNSPYGQLFERAFELVFQKHPYRWPVIGYAKDIADYKLKDMTDWYQTYYSPNNAVLVLSGKFSENPARKLIEKYFGPLPAKKIPEEQIIDEPEQLHPRRAVLKKDVPIENILMVWRTPGYGTKEDLALRIVSYIFGAGESSRLYKALVRKSNLLQDISCWLWDLSKHNLFIISYTLPKQSQESQVKQEIFKELKKIFSEGITPEEFKKVKNMQLNTIVHRLKRSSSRADHLALNEMYFGDYRKLYSHLDQMGKLSVDFIKDTAKKSLKEDKLSYLKLSPEEKK
ncbi:MAG: pitrilysin family protein, partial [Bdellovibrionales bacterium]|nr:pitrilysin family protein [Bdellovibrionales bacterium]